MLEFSDVILSKLAKMLKTPFTVATNVAYSESKCGQPCTFVSCQYSRHKQLEKNKSTKSATRTIKEE